MLAVHRFRWRKVFVRCSKEGNVLLERGEGRTYSTLVINDGVKSFGYNPRLRKFLVSLSADRKLLAIQDGKACMIPSNILFFRTTTDQGIAD